MKLFFIIILMTNLLVCIHANSLSNNQSCASSQRCQIRINDALVYRSHGGHGAHGTVYNVRIRKVSLNKYNRTIWTCQKHHSPPPGVPEGWCTNATNGQCWTFKHQNCNGTYSFLQFRTDIPRRPAVLYAAPPRSGSDVIMLLTRDREVAVLKNARYPDKVLVRRVHSRYTVRVEAFDENSRADAKILNVCDSSPSCKT